MFGADDSVPFEDLPEGAYLSVAEPTATFFTDASSWEAFWYAHVNVFDGSGNQAPPPVIDFATTTAVVIALGPYGSGCTHAAQLVKRVEREGDVAVVSVRRLPRNDGVTCTMGITPIQAVTFEKADDVRFVGAVPR